MYEKELEILLEKGWRPIKIADGEYRDLGMFFNIKIKRYKCIDTDEKGDLQDAPTKDSVYYYNLPKKYMPEWLLTEERQNLIKDLIKE